MQTHKKKFNACYIEDLFIKSRKLIEGKDWFGVWGFLSGWFTCIKMLSVESSILENARKNMLENL